MQITSLTNNLIPAQILIYLFGALVNIIMCNRRLVNIITLITGTLISVALCAYILENGAISFTYGGFASKIGIEYKVDKITALIIFLINFLFSTVIILGKGLLVEQVFEGLSKERVSVIQSITLLLQAGFNGMVMTNDLFHLYVCIEIVSLCSYVLVSLGKNKFASVGAIEYLILGSIGAMLILLGIGFMFSVTGTLNMSDIGTMGSPKTTVFAISMFVVGVLMKLAVFPFQAFAVRAYSFAAPIIIAFLAPISSLVGFYILLKLFYLIIYFAPEFTKPLSIILSCFGVLNILFNSVLILFTKNLRKIIIQSSFISIGIALTLISLNHIDTLNVALIYMYTDTINKAILLLGCALIENFYQDTRFGKSFVKLNVVTVSCILLALLSILGLPPTIGFINKFIMLKNLYNHNHFIIFAIFIYSSLINLIYIYKLFERLYFEEDEGRLNVIEFRFEKVLIVLLTAINILFALYSTKIYTYVNKIIGTIWNY